MHYGFKTKYWPIFADILQFPFCDRKKIADILSAKTLIYRFIKICDDKQSDNATDEASVVLKIYCWCSCDFVYIFVCISRCSKQNLLSYM